MTYKLITHSGEFHADDVLVAAMLRVLNPELVMERVAEVPADAFGEPGTMVADIGRREFDHHQEDAGRRPDGHKHAACGLVLNAIREELFPDGVPEEFLSAVEKIEDVDNGVQIPDPHFLSEYAALANPLWDEDRLPDDAFEETVKAVQEDFVLPYVNLGLLPEKIRQKWENAINSLREKNQRAEGRAAKLVHKAYQASDGRIVVLPRSMPWQKELCPSSALYVIYPSERGDGEYLLQCVPPEPDSFEKKKELPGEWLKDKKPKGCTFVHTALFIASFRTVEEAYRAVSDHKNTEIILNNGRRIEVLFNFKSGNELASAIPEENEIWIDTGKELGEGVFNHDQSGENFTCTFDAVRSHESYLMRTLRHFETCEDRNTLFICTHAIPDMDAIASSFYVLKWLAGRLDGTMDFPSDGVWDALGEYVRGIETGHNKIVTRHTLYAHYCKVGESEPDSGEILSDEDRSKEVIRETLCILEELCRVMADPGKEIDLFKDQLGDYIDTEQLDYFESIEKLLSSVEKNYEDDKRDGRVKVSEKKIWLWNKNKKQSEPVKAAVWVKAPTGEDGYCVAREKDNCLLTVYPTPKDGADQDGTLHEVKQVVISLNPDVEGYENYSLLPIAEVLEQCEQMEDEKEYQQSKRYPRDRSCPRRSREKEDPEKDAMEDTEPRKDIWTQPPFRQTNDPWSIMVNEGVEDIIFSPFGGTRLTYDRILSVIRNTCQEQSFIRDCTCIRYRKRANTEDGNAADKKKGESEGIPDAGRIEMESFPRNDIRSLGELYEFGKNRLAELPKDKGNHDAAEYIYICVTLADSILTGSNEILKYICFNMIGKEDSVLSQDNIRFLEYRTCMYSDQAVTIVLSTESSSQSLRRLIGKGEETSVLARDLQTLLGQRNEYRNLSDFLMNASEEGEEVIEQMNTDLVKLTAQIQNEDIIIDSQEQEIYRYLKNILDIEALRKNVTEAAGLIIENADQQGERRLNFTMAMVSVLAVFSALVDSFDFFKEMIDLKITLESLKNIQYVLGAAFELISVAIIAIVIFLAVKANWKQIVRVKEETLKCRNRKKFDPD